MKISSYLGLAGGLAILALALPAGADLQVISADRFYKVDVQADGGPALTVTEASDNGGLFDASGNATSGNTGDGSVFGSGAQNSTIPLVYGYSLTGSANASIQLAGTVSAANAMAQSVLNVTFTPTESLSFNFGGNVGTPQTGVFSSSSVMLTNTTTNTTIVNAVSGPFSATGMFLPGNNYQVVATATVNGTLGSNSGTGTTTGQATWNFDLTASEVVPEPGTLAMLTGCCVTGVFAWRRRRAS
jgi:hypothetical protein